jgi:hypothetical protein
MNPWTSNGAGASATRAVGMTSAAIVPEPDRHCDAVQSSSGAAQEFSRPQCPRPSQVYLALHELTETTCHRRGNQPGNRRSPRRFATSSTQPPLPVKPRQRADSDRPSLPSGASWRYLPRRSPHA